MDRDVPVSVASPVLSRPGMDLAFDRVTHRYGATVAVQALSLTAGQGEIVCLVGPSGCGKSTTLRLAAGLERVQDGTIRLGNRVVADGVTDVPPEQRQLGFVFQDFALFPHLSVLQNVAFGLKTVPAADRVRIAHDMLARVHMGRFADAYPHSLSGGEQQRVALARALAPRPRLMLLDEPFSGLDTRLRDAVRDETLALLKQSGAPALLVTHDAMEAMRMADRIALLRAGVLQQAGTPDAIYHRPANAFVAAFFGPVNRLAARVAAGRVDTPFGPVPAPGLTDGAAAEVVVRYEGLRPGQGTAVATVAESRLLGPVSEVAFALPGLPQPWLAHVPGAAPTAGAVVPVALDPRQTFVFAAENPAS